MLQTSLKRIRKTIYIDERVRMKRDYSLDVFWSTHSTSSIPSFNFSGTATYNFLSSSSPSARPIGGSSSITLWLLEGEHCCRRELDDEGLAIPNPTSQRKGKKKLRFLSNRLPRPGMAFLEQNGIYFSPPDEVKAGQWSLALSLSLVGTHVYFGNFKDNDCLTIKYTGSFMVTNLTWHRHYTCKLHLN